MRRLAIALGAALTLLGIASLSLSAPAGAQSGSTSATNFVDVVEVSGLVDRVLADQLDAAVVRAERQGSQALILQMNTRGAVVSNERIAALAVRIKTSTVPVAIWVGPSGARAYGAPAQLLAAAARIGIAPGARIGHFGPPVAGIAWPTDVSRLTDDSIGAVEAATLLNLPSTPVIGDMVVQLDGLTYGGKTLSTARVVEKNGGPRREATVQARFFKLGLIPRLMHTVGSPPVAYLLLIIGLGLMVFEFFTAGVGVAGVVGVMCLVLGCYGVAALPTRWWALGLIIASIVAFAIDVQTGVPRFWTGVGIVAFVVGSVTLYRDFHLPWVTLVAAVIGVLLAFLTGMPSMVRTRFSTPTIGREWMIGELGEAVGSVDPNGVVSIGNGQWRAYTNRATPIAAGGRVRVVAVDGITLEVEPEAGGARDHRERARSRTEA